MNIWFSKIVIILANLVPLVGVVFFDWSFFSIIFLYWFENVVIGIYTILRMLKCEAGGPTQRYPMTVNGELKMVSKVGLTMFFVLHYGLFTSVHGVFVYQFFGPFDIPIWSFMSAAASLFVSHGVSFFTNFIGHEEYKKIFADTLMIQPYPRIIIVHLTVLFGGMIMKTYGATVRVLILMIILKTTIDLIAHSIEHRNFKPLRL